MLGQACNDEKVSVYRKRLKDAEEAARGPQSSDNPHAASAVTAAEMPAAGETSEQGAQRSMAKPARSVAAAAEIRNAIKEYRELIWRAVFHRAAL